MARESKKDGVFASLQTVLQLGFIGAAAVAVFSFVSVSRDSEMRRRCTPLCMLRPNYAAANRKAPNFTLKDMKGKDVTLASLAGKVVVMNFWTKTCGPCMEEMPEVAELARVLSTHDDVAFLTVSTDEGPEAVRDVLGAVLRFGPNKELPFPVLFDPDMTVVGDKFGTHLFPETWILDKRGVVRARFDGARSWTNPVVVELVEQIANDGYCPAEFTDGRPSREAQRLCGTGNVN
ncbi:MAG: TlpA disulfide reductase family protein [Polyangiaceae bacterium]